MPLNRRSFLHRAALGFTAPYLLGMTRLGAAPPSDSIGIGLIGCGSLGVGYHLNTDIRMPDVRIVAVCDVDKTRREQAASTVQGFYKDAAKPGCYNDYREMLERKDLDGVIVVTPDHWHALPTIHACQAGKDVHCEKPLSLTIEEGRAMVTAARRYGRIVQTGSESRSKPRVRLACELVRSGRIGKLHTVRTGLGGNPTSPWEPNTEPPPGLDWNLWLGQAPWVPYTPKRCFYEFRWFIDYSGGKLTDWGAHMNDIAQWGIGADDSGPVLIEGKGQLVPNNMYEFPPTFEAVYTYANGVKLICTSEAPHVTFIGTQGTIRTGLDGCDSDPPAIATVPLGPNDVHLYESHDHDRDWLGCMRTRKLPVADVEIGHRACTVCHLGNVTIWLGRPVRWNPIAERFVDDPEADRLISRPMRAPWHL